MKTLHPSAWGFEVSETGELLVGGCSTVELAGAYGTPLHVLNVVELEQRARRFRETVEFAYEGKTSVHYAFKCNSVPAVIDVVQRAGLMAEVTTEFELELALHLGYRGEQVIVNGPCKTRSFLQRCLRSGVRLLVIDSLEELQDLIQVAAESDARVNVLLRVNPDYVAKGMNYGSATGSRRGCAFGLDLKGGEVETALRFLRRRELLHFQGFHFHIGTGIRNPKDYGRALRCLPGLLKLAQSMGFRVKVLDVGGGFASMTTRELTGSELLLYQGFGRLPSTLPNSGDAHWEDFAQEIGEAVRQCFTVDDLPELIYEPGRTITSPTQCLLLTVHRIKERPGAGKWLLTDGGLGTVTLPTYYEYHEVFLCNDVHRPRKERVTIIGPACFAGDIVYRNKMMPRVHVGEVLAIMDSGAYFIALESSFGFSRPAIVTVNGTSHRLARSRETFHEMIARDRIIHVNDSIKVTIQ